MIKINRNSKGFTLIELLIVIAIIGILAAIAIPAYTGYTKKSKMSGVTSAMGALKNAIVAYHTETGAVTAADNTTYKTIYGLEVPSQYVTSVAVTSTGADQATITSTLGTNIITAGGTVSLSASNVAGGTWSWAGSSNDINALLPK